jgi:tRNA(adenine34) deaminase
MNAKYMEFALNEAKKAALMGEVPIGAVVVMNGKIIASAHNLCESLKDPTAHAEILAMKKAAEVVGDFRLKGAELYVTLEPCAMCAGAAINARVGRIVFAAKDARAGACGSLLDLASYPLEARPKCECGMMQEESLALLRDFFADLRNK